MKIFGEPNLLQELVKKIFYQKSTKTWILSEFFWTSFGIHAEFFHSSCDHAEFILEFFHNSFCCILPLLEKQKTVKFFKKSDNNSFQNSDQNSTHKSNKLCLMYVIIPSLNNILCEPIEDKMFHIYLFSSPSLKCRVGLLRLKTNSFLYALPPPQCAMDHRIKKFCLFSFFGHP